MISIKVYNDINLNLYRYRLLCIALFTISLLCLSFFLRNAPIGDFANYYYGSYLLMHGSDVFDIYDPATFNELILRSGSNGLFANYAPVPPFSLLFYFPFAIEDIFTSKLFFNVISSLAFSASLYRIIIFCNQKLLDIIILLLIILIPVYSNVLLGQSYLLILAFLIEGYIFSSKGRRILAAICFSIPIALKIFPAIILIWLFFSDRKKEFLFTILFSFLLFVSVIPFTGVHFVIHYISSVLPRLMNGEINDPFSVSYQSMSVLLKKLLIYDAHLNPNSRIDSFIIYSILNLLIVSLMLNIIIQLIKKYNQFPFFTFGMTVFAGFLISGYGTNYSLVLLILVGFSFMENESTSKYKNIIYLLLLLITFFPVHKLKSLPELFQFGRLYTMILLFFFIYPVTKIKISNSYFLIIAMILLIPVLYNSLQAKDKSTYYFSHEPSLLITNYKFKQDGVMTYYFGRKGMDSLYYKTNDNISCSDKLSLKNNQIYYDGKQITQGKDIKKGPLMLINDKEVLYLSDMGRGVGLTALRKIRICSNH